MGNIFITADHHFDHANIIDHCERPFVDVDEMNDVLIARWNERVKPGDEVWHVGDFAWTQAAQFRKYLNGNIHLVQGNHDHEGTRAMTRCFADVHDIFELKAVNPHFWLCHYPMITWPGKERGTLMLHGHCHGNLEKWKVEHMLNHLIFDIGVDLGNFYPVAVGEVLEAARRRKNPVQQNIFGDEP